MIITVKEARKILGSAYQDYSNESIARLISSLDSIAEEYIKAVLKVE